MYYFGAIKLNFIFSNLWNIRFSLIKYETFDVKKQDSLNKFILRNSLWIGHVVLNLVWSTKTRNQKHILYISLNWAAASSTDRSLLSWKQKQIHSIQFKRNVVFIEEKPIFVVINYYYYTWGENSLDCTRKSHMLSLNLAMSLLDS